MSDDARTIARRGALLTLGLPSDSPLLERENAQAEAEIHALRIRTAGNTAALQLLNMQTKGTC